MKLEHLGQLVDIDPKRAALENRIVHYMKRCGALTQKALWLRVRSRGISFDGYRVALDALVERGIAVRQSTLRKNSFVLHLADKREKPAEPQP